MVNRTELRRWLSDNAPFVASMGCVTAAIVLLAAAIFWQQHDVDPLFVCSEGKHFTAAYVDRVATFGCFDDKQEGAF